MRIVLSHLNGIISSYRYFWLIGAKSFKPDGFLSSFCLEMNGYITYMIDSTWFLLQKWLTLKSRSKLDLSTSFHQFSNNQPSIRILNNISLLSLSCYILIPPENCLYVIILLFLQERPKPCNNPKVCNLWHKSGVRYMKTCQPCPDFYPWTGKTAVKNSVLERYLADESWYTTRKLCK